jgi:hypothetical protein
MLAQPQAPENDLREADQAWRWDVHARSRAEELLEEARQIRERIEQRVRLALGLDHPDQWPYCR